MPLLPTIVTPKPIGPSILDRMRSLSRAWRDTRPELQDIPTSERVERKWGALDGFIELTNRRNDKYKEYDEMDREIVEIASALDIYADFIVSGGMGSDDIFKLEAETNEARINDTVENLERRLDLKERVWYMARSAAKYGDSYYEVVVSPYEVVKLVNLSPYSIYLNKDDKGAVRQERPYVQKDSDIGKILAEFEPWELIHFKTGEDDYGVDFATLARARRTYKIIRMLEDSVLVGRLTRAHQRLVYKVDTTNMGMAEGLKYVDKLRNMYKTRTFTDSSGNLKTEVNPLRPQEDIWLPVRKDRAAGVDVISGDSSVSAIADIEYFHNKLFAATKVPKAYLGFERDVNAKATLTQQHLAFSKVVRRFRHVLSYGLKHLYRVEFLMKGINPNSFAWKLKFPGLGDADQELRWSIEAMKANVINSYLNSGISLPVEWVLRHIFLDLSPAECDEIMDLWNADAPTLGKNPILKKEEAPPEGAPKLDLAAILTGLKTKPKAIPVLPPVAGDPVSVLGAGRATGKYLSTNGGNGNQALPEATQDLIAETILQDEEIQGEVERIKTLLRQGNTSEYF